MADEDKSSIKIAPFSGKQTDWPVWREKFMARARRKGYKNILIGKDKAPDDSEMLDKTNAAHKEKIALRDANEMAYEALLLLIDGEQATGRVAFNIVRGSKTEELADGDAALAWKRLCDKYEPRSAPSRLALKNRFLHCDNAGENKKTEEFLKEKDSCPNSSIPRQTLPSRTARSKGSLQPSMGGSGRR